MVHHIASSRYISRFLDITCISLYLSSAQGLPLICHENFMRHIYRRNLLTINKQEYLAILVRFKFVQVMCRQTN